MPNQYAIRNLRIDRNSLPWRIQLSFHADEQRRINLAHLHCDILSIRFDVYPPSKKTMDLVLEHVSRYAKSSPTNIQISVSEEPESTMLAPSFSFSGGLGSDQLIDLTTDATRFLSPHSVLIFAFDSRTSSK